MRPVIAGTVRHGRSTRWWALVAVFLCACSAPDSSPTAAAITPAYDPSTGKLTELSYDSNHNGAIDTWTDMDGARPVQTRIDRNEDGRIDRWEYYDAKSQLIKVGFSRTDNGKVDAWAFAGVDGAIERVEISTAADDRRIDRWEHYTAGAIAAAEEDGNHDGTPDKWETYESGAVKTVAFDENADGRPDRRLTYAGGSLATIETEPDAAGRFTKTLDVNRPDPAAARSPQ
jgi:hypothetical protein